MYKLPLLPVFSPTEEIEGRQGGCSASLAGKENNFMTVAEKLNKIEIEIEDACQRTGRSRNEITIIAVTKSVSVERTEEAMEAGLVHFGENEMRGFKLNGIQLVPSRFGISSVLFKREKLKIL